ncbi:MAG TPA: tetratricopeptide repeat protein [Chitinivibrionales bacterium]
MTKKKIETLNLEGASLRELCELIRRYIVPFEDAAEYLEDKIYAGCAGGDSASSLCVLAELVDFFERIPEKNEENCRDLADIYILIGEVHQYLHQFAESIAWFNKAAIVFDRYATPYHNLATSYAALGDIDNAIKSLEQETALEPGNYFSILRLVDFYESRGEFDKAEDGLKKILERNPDNIKALHKLIEYYEKEHPEVDVALLRRRLLAVNRDLNEFELVISTYHLCRGKKLTEAVSVLTDRITAAAGDAMAHLLLAHVYGELHLYSKKRKTLTEFKKCCFGKIKFMQNKIEEFEHIFGKHAAASVEKNLLIAAVS